LILPQNEKILIPHQINQLFKNSNEKMLHSPKWKLCIFPGEAFTYAIHGLRFISELHLKMGGGRPSTLNHFWLLNKGVFFPRLLSGRVNATGLFS